MLWESSGGWTATRREAEQWWARQPRELAAVRIYDSMTAEQWCSVLTNDKPYLPTEQYAALLRRMMTPSERLLWAKIKDRGFLSQHPIGPFFADFALPSRMLVVEVDGDYHLQPEQVIYDRQRDLFFSQNGWQVVRVPNHIVDNKMEEVIRLIVGWQRSRPYVKKTARHALKPHMRITRGELEAGKSPSGGYTRRQLALWGVPYPPKKGWKDRLLKGK